MWHYAIGEVQRGPVSAQEIESMLRSGMLRPDSLVWREGMPQWIPLHRTELASLAAAVPPPPPVAAVNGVPRTSCTPGHLDVLFTWWMWLAIPATLLSLIPILALFCLPVIIAGTVFHCILLYRMWDLIQDLPARTTPGKAVGFLFIPFFNFYWVFVAYHGLACDLNRYTETRRVVTPRVSEGLGLTVAILAIVGCTVAWVPLLGGALGIVSLIINILFFMSARDCAKAIAASNGAAVAG